MKRSPNSRITMSSSAPAKPNRLRKWLDAFLHREPRPLLIGEAKRIVRNNGFRNVATRECDGRTYTFTANRNGHRILVFVNSRTGAVWRG